MIEVIKIALDIYFLGMLGLRLYEKFLKVAILRLQHKKIKSEFKDREK